MVKDLLYGQRAVSNFCIAAERGKLSPRHVRDILRHKSRDIDIEPIVPLLQSDDPWIRKCVAQIVGAFGGNQKSLIEAAKCEDDRDVLLELLKQLVSTKEGLEEMVYLLESEDKAVKQSGIDMFRKAGRADCLMGLLFDDDDELVSRIKRYMNEQDNKEVS